MREAGEFEVEGRELLLNSNREQGDFLPISWPEVPEGDGKRSEGKRQTVQRALQGNQCPEGSARFHSMKEVDVHSGKK